MCMPSALGPVALGLLAYISGKSLMPMLQLLHVARYRIRYNSVHVVTQTSLFLL